VRRGKKKTTGGKYAGKRPALPSRGNSVGRESLKKRGAILPGRVSSYMEKGGEVCR